MTDEQPTTVCPNCGDKVPLVAEATPCPTCGKRVHSIGMQATSKGEASMSKTVSISIHAISKGVPSLEATWEEWQELRKRHYGWTAVELGLTFGSPAVGYFLGDTTGMFVGWITGGVGWWVAPKAERTWRERVRKRLRVEGK